MSNPTKKYELIEETTEKVGIFEKVIKLHRIRALRDIDTYGMPVKKGDLGGFVESEANLSQEDESWIYDDACACNNSKVEGDSCVSGKAVIWDNVIIRNSHISERAEISGNAKICNSAVLDDSRVTDNVEMMDVLLSGNVHVKDDAFIKSATIEGTYSIYGNARIDGGEDEEHKYGIIIIGNGNIGSKAMITKSKDFISLSLVIGDDYTVRVPAEICAYLDKDKNVFVSICTDFEIQEMSIEHFKEYVKNINGSTAIVPIATMIENYFKEIAK